MKFLNEQEFLEVFGDEIYRQAGYNSHRVIIAKNDLFHEFIEFINDDKKGIYLSCKRRYYPLTTEILFNKSDIDSFVKYDNKEEMKNKIAVLECCE